VTVLSVPPQDGAPPSVPGVYLGLGTTAAVAVGTTVADGPVCPVHPLSARPAKTSVAIKAGLADFVFGPRS
jgi:hypothetical protein